MHIVIPGALPPASVASDLARAIGQDCPALIRLFERLSPRVVPLHPAQTGCTPVEHEMLEQAGGLAVQQTRPVGALAAMHAGVTHLGETVWVAQMCAMSIGHDQVTLSLPDELDIQAEESNRLMNDVLAMAPPSGFRLTPIQSKVIAHIWRVQFESPVAYVSISPKAVRALGVTNWWPQDESTKVWRKWLNEAQMAWHNHPVNQDRLSRGQGEINGLWLYGGGLGWNPVASQPGRTTLHDLQAFHENGDWSGWIRSLRSLNERLAHHADINKLTLLGDARKVVLTLERSGWWRFLLGSRKQTWSQWWIPQA